MAKKTTATIANGASLSGAIDMNRIRSSAEGMGGHGIHLAAIQMPSAWTAANITFQGSVDGSTYYDLYDQYGTEILVTAAASRVILLDLSMFAGINFVKLRSGTTGTAVNQAADRAIVLGLRVV